MPKLSLGPAPDAPEIEMELAAMLAEIGELYANATVEHFVELDAYDAHETKKLRKR